MKLYILVTDDPKYYPYYHIAFTHPDMAELESFDLPEYKVKEIELSYIGKYVCFAHVYYGFSYGWETIYDVTEDSDVYHCINAAKESALWQKLMERIEKEGAEKYVICDTNDEHFIASKDSCFGHWFYGDVMEGKFCAKIRRIRVIKETYGDMIRRKNAFRAKACK